MRIRRFLLAAVALAAALAPGFANAGQPCVTYSVTGPLIGTKSGTHCGPNIPFNQGITFGNCGGMPPVGESHCWSVKVYLP